MKATLRFWQFAYIYPFMSFTSNSLIHNLGRLKHKPVFCVNLL